MTKLYFYEIGAYGYEEAITKTYYSRCKYVQEEFEDIVFNVLKILMENLIEKTPESLCFYNIYFHPDDLILEKGFDNLMALKGFHNANAESTGVIRFTTTSEPNKYNDKLEDEFLKLDIDESCKNDNCSRIPELPVKEKESCKKTCGITIREKHRWQIK